LFYLTIAGLDFLIPFCKQHLIGDERTRVNFAMQGSSMSGPGAYSTLCENLISQQMGGAPAMLVTSCSAALEIAAILLNLQPNDEVIMPSYTFITTATSVALRGATPVFVDVDNVTFNIDPHAVKRAITPRTKAIFVVHYAGVPADMTRLTQIAQPHGIKIVEDAAQAYGSSLNGQPAGSLGAMSCFSFHGTKNISAGEGGALVINDPDLVERAEIVREKGSDRKRFLAGAVQFYTWQDIGSSYVTNEMTAAFLSAQLEGATAINARRVQQWNFYKEALAEPTRKGHFNLPDPPDTCAHNGHCFFVMTKNKEARSDLSQFLSARGITAVSHYVPLHSSPAGKRLARHEGEMHSTDRAGDCLLRLPLWHDMGDAQEIVVNAVHEWCAR
jgi:dTDP-4-amino-4,6-dideoxygalactose transaminase